MHKWVEHLTHTNIHISPEEEIPQGWDRAICEENKTQHPKQNNHASAKVEGILQPNLKTFKIFIKSHFISLQMGVVDYQEAQAFVSGIQIQPLENKTLFYSWF